MRWERFFEDLEHQLDSEWEAERAALDTEAERLRLSRLALRDRLASLAGDGCDLSIELPPQTVLSGRLTGVGADWATLDSDLRRGAALVPLAPVVAVGMPHADLLRSARPASGTSLLAERMTLGFVLRDLGRRRSTLRVHTTSGRSFTGTIDRAGFDHLDLALHDGDEPRRGSAVKAHRMIPFTAVAWVQLDGSLL